MKYSAIKSSLRTLAIGSAFAALFAPAIAFAEMPEIDCSTLSDADSEKFYGYYDTITEQATNGDLDAALKSAQTAMKMCTTDAATEYSLARVYQQRGDCTRALFHFERLNNRIADIKAEDKDLAKAITKYYKETSSKCGDAINFEITCETPGTKLRISGQGVDDNFECPLYTKFLPGGYDITATREKFYPYKDEFIVVEGGNSFAVPALSDADDFGILRVKCPRGALKFTLTDAKGRVNEYACPWEGKVASGTYKIQLGGKDVGSPAEITVAKDQQVIHEIPSEVKSNCSASIHNTTTGVGAILMMLLASFGLVTLRRKREN